MATQPQETPHYVVIAAFRKEPSGRSTVGYFKTTAEMPPEFKHPWAQDITGVMKSIGLTDLERCLEIMNCHWKTPSFPVVVTRR